MKGFLFLPHSGADGYVSSAFARLVGLVCWVVVGIVLWVPVWIAVGVAAISVHLGFYSLVIVWVICQVLGYWTWCGILRFWGAFF